MPVALAGRTPATFEIKSATLPLVALLLKSTDLAQLGEELKARFGDMPEFFDHDPLVIDLAPLSALREAEIDFAELLHLLRGYRVMPVAIKGGSAGLRLAAQRAGLAIADEAAERAGPAAPARSAAPPQEEAQMHLAPARAHGGDAMASPGAAAPGSAAAPPTGDAVPATALVVDKPVRSGQRIYARGRDLVVLSMVNPGAEVIADGSIHVYAPLRGKAMAGARGDATARILTLCLEPELISVAGVYRTSEVPFPASVRGKPAQVRLQGDGDAGKLLVERLNA